MIEKSTKPLSDNWQIDPTLTTSNYSHVKTLTLNDKGYKWIVFLRCLGWFFFFTIFVNMGRAPVPEEPKIDHKILTYNERHPSGYEEWNGQKAEAVPLSRWPEEAK